MAFSLSSPVFADRGPIPREYTGEGLELSPPLSWSTPPAGTRSYALVMHDPDASSGDFTHWLVWDIDGAKRELPEGNLIPAGHSDGRNSFGETGYGGPMPPHGTGPHHYLFELYALSLPRLSLPAGIERRQLEYVMKPHILGIAVLEGTYERK